MNADRRRQIEKLYHEALRRSQHERGAFLAEACHGDAELLTRDTRMQFGGTRIPRRVFAYAPATGLWNVKGYDLENYGVPPDVDVDNTPEDFLAGRDAQVEKAVEVLKQEMKKK